MSGAGAERRFPAAQLFPAVAVVLAGLGEGGLPRPRFGTRGIRPLHPFAELRVPAAERHFAEGIRAAGEAAGLHAVQRVPARPLRSEERRVGKECVSPCRSWWL